MSSISNVGIIANAKTSWPMLKFWLQLVNFLEMRPGNWSSRCVIKEDLPHQFCRIRDFKQADNKNNFKKMSIKVIEKYKNFSITQSCQTKNSNPVLW